MARTKKKAKAKTKKKTTRKSARKKPAARRVTKRKTAKKKAVRKAPSKKRAAATKKKPAGKRKKAAKKKAAGRSKGRTLIVLFNLRRGVSAAAYEKWAQTTDIPIAGGLKSVRDFKVYRAEGVFGSKARPPYKYFEILHVSGLDALVRDIGNEPRMAGVAAAFQKFADKPIFIVTEKFAG